MSLLASLKRHHRGAGRHLAQNIGEKLPQSRDGDGRNDSAGVSAASRKSLRLRLNDAITLLWVVLLLSIVVYALVDGEAMLAQLDGLDLVAAYSIAP